MRIYLDSNVFISAVRDEIDTAFNLRGRDAELFIGLCAKEKFTLILSTWFLQEVENNAFLNQEDVVNFFTARNVKFEIIKKLRTYTSECLEIVHKFGIHYADSMHIILAKQSNCDLIVSWNKKDFEKTIKLIDYKTPEEFLTLFSRHNP